MSPRGFGKVDRSAADPWKCRDCPYRHAPGSACPPPGVSLSQFVARQRANTDTSADEPPES